MNEPQVLAWNDQLAVGLPEIDAEHRVLIDLINNLGLQRVTNAVGEKLLEVVRELRSYTEYHFRHEEDLMQRYPISDDHRQTHLKAHHGFIERLDSVEKLVLSNPADVIDHLLAFLVKWLVFHIGGIDARLAREIVALRAGTPSDQISTDKDWLESGLIRTVSELYDSLGLRTFEMLELNYKLQNEIEQRRQTEEALRLAALVYQHAGEAMVVTDADNSIVAVNPAFTRLTGYSPEEVLGKNPKLMSSGRHDKSFYEEMWQAILTEGRWEGEIWNRRKNSEEYAEWLAINTIRNEEGAIHRHVALFSDITKKKEAEEIIRNQANYDTLTQLPNRRLFHDRLEQAIRHAHRAGHCMALLFLDLDRFKEVNDTLGHQAGDSLLVEASRRIVECVRETDTVARLGGDEFTVILTELSDPSHVDRVAQCIIQRLSEPFLLGGEDVYVSASIGITFYPTDAGDVESLLKNADQAMYVAKNGGRNRYSFFTASLQETAQSRQRLVRDLHGALASDQFTLYFQPIMELATGRIVKAEALLRWQHAERGMISPTEFIPLAEETGLIVEIGNWVFRQSAYWVERWARLAPQGFQISVNKSPVQFHAADGLHDDWPAILRERGLSGHSIVAEITEGLLLDMGPGVTDKLLNFRDAGIQVAIDDFGTGYSSLSYLKKLDIDYLKIDQSFVREIATAPNDMALCEAIIMMAHKLGLKVVAEGVETEQQCGLLAAAGCDYAQGFLFSPPIPAEDFEEMLKHMPGQ